MNPLEVTAALKDVIDAENRALEQNDLVALKVLAAEEARLMDILRVFFR